MVWVQAPHMITMFGMAVNGLITDSLKAIRSLMMILQKNSLQISLGQQVRRLALDLLR